MVLYSNPDYEVYVKSALPKMSIEAYIGNTFFITVYITKETSVRGLITFQKKHANLDVLYGLVWLENTDKIKDVDINANYQCHLTKQVLLEDNGIEAKINVDFILRVRN